LQRIREIRLSERKFYQKITDIYATSIDYDVSAQATQRFLPPCKTSCIGRYMGKLRLGSFTTEPMRAKRTWG
jgi:Virulence protein RhuM family